ncbi:MAG: hypothetical protein KAJ14_14830, partial [Candidatus Omnitrophica bacterium]|nr:hypothetical protein [Candidatus Omnitrophota bacterium]
MTGTYNLIVEMMNGLWIEIDRSERDELVLKYIDISNGPVLRTIARYIEVSEEELIVKKSGLIIKKTDFKNLDKMANQIAAKLQVNSTSTKEVIKTEIKNIKQAKGDILQLTKSMNKILDVVSYENNSVTIETLAMAIVNSSPFADAEIKSVQGVGQVDDAFQTSIKSVLDNGHQNYVVIPEAEGLHQPEIKQKMVEHLEKMQNKENFQFVYHDSNNNWTLYRWDSDSNKFKEFSGKFNGDDIKNGNLDLKKHVQKMLENSQEKMQTVILCNVGDVFGLDLKVDARTKFVDIMDQKTMLTNAMQGFGRMRGYENGTRFNDREVYVVGEKLGKLDLSKDVFEKLIETEKKEVKKITLNVLVDAIKHSGISLLKEMQDNAAGAPVSGIGRNSMLGHGAFAVGEKMFSFGGIILSTYLKSVKQHADLQKTADITEYELIEKKLVELWNQLGQDQDNSVSTPQKTEEYLEKRLTEVQKHFEDLLNDNEFTNGLSGENKDILQGFVDVNKTIFNDNYETEIKFLEEGKTKKINPKHNLFAVNNTLKSVSELISQTIKRNDLPLRAAFGHSNSSQVSTRFDQAFANESVNERKAQAKFMGDEGHKLIRSDDTLTEKGAIYVNQLYKKLDNLSKEDLAVVLAAIPALAFPPEEEEKTGSISRGLVDLGYIDLADINKDTVVNLVNIAYGVKLFGNNLSPEALQELQKPETMKQMLADSPLSLRKYLMDNISSVSEGKVKDILENISVQVNLENEIRIIEKELYSQSELSTPTMSKKKYNNLCNNLSEKKEELKQIQIANPVTAEIIVDLARIFAPKDTDQDTVMYQVAKVLFMPNLTFRQFKSAKNTETILN